MQTNPSEFPDNHKTPKLNLSLVVVQTNEPIAC